MLTDERNVKRDRSPVTEAAPRPAEIRVLKFGGSSVRDADRIRAVAGLIARAREEATPVVVVSAVGGTTDVLVAIADVAGGGSSAYEERIREIEGRHRAILIGVAPPDERGALESRLSEAFEEIRRLARGTQLLGECSPRTRDRLLAFGELLSSMLVAACLRAQGIPARDVDARHLIVTDDRFGGARVDPKASDDRIRAELPGTSGIPVVTGFIGATASGETTTLGRGASDYTATLLGAALSAERVEIWTDVDGVLTADPRSVPDAQPIREIGYEELLELAHFGAEVICAPAVEPARRAGIPLRIRSTLEPTLPGTLVVGRQERDPYHPVRGMSAIRDVVLLRLEGVEALGITSTCERLFRALHRADVDSLLFTQDSSAHSVSLAVPRAGVDRAVASIEVEFRREREAGLLGSPVKEENRSVLAIVGEGMRDTPGIAGRLFSTLGAAKVNVHAVAQGSSERNISWVVSSEQEGPALRAVHRAFFSPPGELHPVRIVVLGAGSVGGTLLQQLGDHAAAALAPHSIRPVLVGIAQSTRAIADLEGLDPHHWRELLASGRHDPAKLVDEVVTGDPLVVVDCTASPEVASRYIHFLKLGAAVVTANKIAFSRSSKEYKELLRAAQGGRGIHHETTVGAGLPMVRTVAELRRSGDKITEMSGVLSGTLTFLFDEINRGRPFSEAVREARERGISEPDPRDDLGLRDVLRKLVILGRTAGYEIEPEEVRLDPILPPRLLQAPSVDAFMELLPELDDEFAARSRAATEKGCRLATVARIDESGGEVGVVEVPLDRPAARIRGTENVLEIRSTRYTTHPILIQGPGAGPKVTAAGLVTDLVFAAERVTHGLRKPFDES
ncbi:MAG: bifunctional aspartate kinase/homoserine dehydrogenase I [Gemmatimonadetes bacterium]|nr:bifunctional aspartate kinase/homoserine dehydrogenase I [Gemmatimonadota bacterium]